MSLRYGIRNVLTDETAEHYPDEILAAVRRLLTRAVDKAENPLDWTTFAAAVYLDEFGPGRDHLVVEVEIAEVPS